MVNTIRISKIMEAITRMIKTNRKGAFRLVAVAALAVGLVASPLVAVNAADAPEIGRAHV